MQNNQGLIDQVRNEIRLRHYSIRTERTYIEWTKRFLAFHKNRSPEDMAAQEIAAFLTHLATQANVANSTQNQAFSALMFLYTNVLRLDIGELMGVVPARNSERKLNVLSTDEVELSMSRLNGTYKLMAMLVYGTGMSMTEVVSLRINDVDFDLQRIMVSDSKDQKNRLVPLPTMSADALRKQMASVKNIHKQDLKDGFGSVYLPRAIERTHPNANKIFHWQYLFPSPSLSIDPRSRRIYRHHISKSAFQKAVLQATREAGIMKDVHSDVFRHSFAVHMLAAGLDIRTVKELLGQSNLKTTQFYMRALKACAHATKQTDLLPTAKRCVRMAWLNRLLRSGLSVEEIEAQRWSRDEGDYSIYCLAENGKRVRYIGITNQAPELRLRQHLADCGRGRNLYKENWIRSCIKRGVPITIHVVRSGLTADRACMMEFELIRFFKKVFTLLNTHAGGATGYAGLSEESKEKHRVNTEKGLIASARRELEAEDMERGYCILEEWGELNELDVNFRE